MVGKLVAKGPTDAGRAAIRGDDVKARNLGLFAAVLRESGAGQRRTRADGDGAVALVEPFGLHPGQGGRLAVLKAHAKHLHAVGHGGLGPLRQLGMHRIAGGGRSQMGQAGAGQMQMRRIGMAQRQIHQTLRRQCHQIDGLPLAMGGHHIGQRTARPGGLHGQRIGALGPLHDGRTACVAHDNGKPIPIPDLRQMHDEILP
jgi:hypothetical protein